MKAQELKKCGICHEGLMANGGLPLFYRVTIETMGVDTQAVRERHGLSLILGSGALAEVFASRSEVANLVHAPSMLLVCLRCATDLDRRHCLSELNAMADEVSTAEKAHG